MRANVALWSRVNIAVDNASKHVLTALFPNMPYDRFRPLAGSETGVPAGLPPYRMQPKDVKDAAERILALTKAAVPHPVVPLPAAFPPGSVKLVSDLNADLAGRIEKQLP